MGVPSHWSWVDWCGSEPENARVMLSFEEAARQYAAAHKVALDVARLAVADDYLEEDRSSEEQRRAKVDRYLLPDNQMFYHPRPKIEGRPVKIDDEVRSRGGMLAKMKAVRRAKEDGDYYRDLSRRTSMNLPEEY